MSSTSQQQDSPLSDEDSDEEKYCTGAPIRRFDMTTFLQYQEVSVVVVVIVSFASVDHLQETTGY